MRRLVIRLPPSRGEPVSESLFAPITIGWKYGSIQKGLGKMGELSARDRIARIRADVLVHLGRAVARIPRVSGGGTHRAGQAAFGNMCRSGRMFAPTKVWRKWYQKVNLGQKYVFTTISNSTCINKAPGASLPPPPWPPLPSLHSSKPGVTASRQSRKCPSSSHPRPSKAPPSARPPPL